jgi:hypothetical protein
MRGIVEPVWLDLRRRGRFHAASQRSPTWRPNGKPAQGPTLELWLSPTESPPGNGRVPDRAMPAPGALGRHLWVMLGHNAGYFGFHSKIEIICGGMF